MAKLDELIKEYREICKQKGGKLPTEQFIKWQCGLQSPGTEEEYLKKLIQKEKLR